MGRSVKMLMLSVAGALALAGCRQMVSTDGGEQAPLDELRQRPLYSFNEAEVGAYLHWLAKAEPQVTERVVHLARKNLGQPYEIYLLGEYPFEIYDPDPLYCLDRSDCLTFCEHMYSMALSSDWWTFLRTLQRLRYRDGQVGMLTRNHYTVVEWDRNNSYLFEDMTTKLGGDVSVPLHQICRQAAFFAKFGIGQDIPDEPVEDAYIPKERAPEVLAELRDADFVNIVRGDQHSQWAGHTGLIVRGEDGTANFLHSAKPIVRVQPLLDYLAKDKRCVGIKILRLRPNAEEIMRRTLADSPKATPISPKSFEQAVRERWEEAPATAKPQRLNWQAAFKLQSYRLGYDSAVDPGLQAGLASIDREVGDRLGIPADERAVGVLDLTNLRVAMVNPDTMFYAASVPKICILLAFFDAHPEAADNLDPEVADELGRMIKLSDNALAAKYGRMLGQEAIQKLNQSSRYRFYDKEHGGLWYGKHYGPGEPRVGDPVHNYSHGATVRQCLRYYLMLEQGRLVSGPASAKMREIFASPELEHLDSAFVAGLAGSGAEIIRKSGSWEDWRLDTARVEHGGHVYLVAGMAHHARAADYLTEIISAIDDMICNGKE